jgi:hypothetical protein
MAAEKIFLIFLVFSPYDIPARLFSFHGTGFAFWINTLLPHFMKNLHAAVTENSAVHKEERVSWHSRLRICFVCGVFLLMRNYIHEEVRRKSKCGITATIEFIIFTGLWLETWTLKYLMLQLPVVLYGRVTWFSLRRVDRGFSENRGMKYLGLRERK